MNNTHSKLCMACGAVLLIATTSAHARAQGFGTPSARQINRPVVSPYLNLTQPGIDPAVGYQTIVRPELQLRSALANQGQMIRDLQRDAAAPAAGAAGTPTRIRQTGHPTAFMNTGSYFPSRGAARRR